MKIETNRLPGFRPNFARTTKHTADGEERTLHVELEGDWIRLTISVPEPSTLSWSGFRFPMKRDPLGETLLFTCEHLKKSGISPETTAAFLQLAMKKLRVPGLLQGRILADLDYLQVVAASERFQRRCPTFEARAAASPTSKRNPMRIWNSLSEVAQVSQRSGLRTRLRMPPTFRAGDILNLPDRTWEPPWRLFKSGKGALLCRRMSGWRNSRHITPPRVDDFNGIAGFETFTASHAASAN